jgi:hypothetical protein
LKTFDPGNGCKAEIHHRTTVHSARYVNVAVRSLQWAICRTYAEELVAFYFAMRRG